jgi:hypothetical protein
VIVDVVAIFLVATNVADNRIGFASDGFNTSLDVSVVKEDETSTAATRGELVAQGDGVESLANRARGRTDARVIARGTDFTKGVTAYDTIRRQHSNLLSEVYAHTVRVVSGSGIDVMSVFVVGFASTRKGPFVAVIVPSSGGCVIFASIIGAIMVPGRTIPTPVKRRRRASTSFARTVLFNEITGSEAISRPYVTSGHNPHKGLMQRSPVVGAFFLDQALERVNPGNGLRAKTSQKGIVGDGPPEIMHFDVAAGEMVDRPWTNGVEIEVVTLPGAEVPRFARRPSDAVSGSSSRHDGVVDGVPAEVIRLNRFETRVPRTKDP